MRQKSRARWTLASQRREWTGSHGSPSVGVCMRSRTEIDASGASQTAGACKHQSSRPRRRRSRCQYGAASATRSPDACASTPGGGGCAEPAKGTRMRDVADPLARSEEA